MQFHKRKVQIEWHCTEKPLVSALVCALTIDLLSGESTRLCHKDIFRFSILVAWLLIKASAKQIEAFQKDDCLNLL